MPVKNCETCGSVFQARLQRIRTCSLACRNRLISSEKQAKHRHTKQCVVCNSSFEVGAIDHGKQTCSAACGYKLRGSKTSRQVSFKCGTCGIDFMSRQSNTSDDGGGRYCSKACLYERNTSTTERACVCCAKLFSSPPSHMHVKTCSTACGYEWFSGPRKAGYVGATRRETRPDGSVVTVTERWYASRRNTARRLQVEKAAPAWADMEKVRLIYELASSLESTTGERYHVDHIVPLISKTVSGLHNEFNLRVLPATDNLKKGNRHWPDMP